MRLAPLLAILELKGMFRQGRYGIQFLLFPLVTISLFLSTYFAVRTLGGQTQALFYPFLVFLLSAAAAGIPMQSGVSILREPSSASLLITPRGLSALIDYFSGIQVAYMATTIITIVVVLISARPEVTVINFVLGLILLLAWCSALVTAGLAMGMRFIFSFQVSQFIFLGFYIFALVLPLAGNPVLAFIFPPIGMMAVFEGRGNLGLNLLATAGGIVIYNLIAMWFLRWAFHEYRIGKGVNRV